MGFSDKSFNYYESGAPYPGICIACSNTTKLWHLGTIQGTNRGAYLCDQDLMDLALYAGFVLKTTHETKVNDLTEENTKLTAQIEAAPKLMKDLTNGVNSLISNFVTELAGLSSTSKPVQPEGSQASDRVVEPSNEAEPAVGEAKGQGPKPSPKPSSK